IFPPGSFKDGELVFDDNGEAKLKSYSMFAPRGKDGKPGEKYQTDMVLDLSGVAARYVYRGGMTSEIDTETSADLSLDSGVTMETPRQDVFKGKTIFRFSSPEVTRDKDGKVTEYKIYSVPTHDAPIGALGQVFTYRVDRWQGRNVKGTVASVMEVERVTHLYRL